SGKTYVNLPHGGRNMTLTLPGQTPAYYDYNRWTTTTGANLGLSISAPAGSQLRLDWNAGLNASSFTVERSADGIAWTTLTSTLPGTATSYTDAGLSQGVIYSYRVTPNGTSLGTSFPVSQMTVYNAPTNLKFTLTATNAITLTWTNNAAGNSGVQLQYSVDGYSQWSWLVNLPASYTSRSPSYTDFTGGERLFYRAVAYSNNGPNGTSIDSPPSNIVGTEFSSAYVGGTTSMPRGLTATPSPSGTPIALSWTDTASNETAYRVDRSSDDGVTWTTLTAALPPNTTSFNDATVVAGITYTYRVSAINGSASSAYSQTASARAAVANAAPTIAQAASAEPNPVTGQSAVLQVLGADDAGEGNLTYSWSLTQGPGSVAFSSNSLNSSKQTTATFDRAGQYTLTVTVIDPQGLRVTSSVRVDVQQTLTSIAITPALRTLQTGKTLQLAATQRDQVGLPMAVSQPIIWSATAGSISSAGLFTAPASAGLSVVSASSGSVFSTLSIRYQTQPTPLASYSFEEGSGTTVADSSGNGFDGTLLGGVTFGSGFGPAGAVGGDLVFDGTGRVQIGDPAALQITGAITLAAWVKSSSTAGIQTIIEKGYNTSGTRGEVFLRINSGKYEVGSWNGANNFASVAIPSGDVGTWVHLLGTYDPVAGKWLLYRNGALLASASTATGAVVVTGRDWTLGGTDIPDRYFTGSIDEVRISNTTTTAADAMALYRSFAAPTIAVPASAAVGGGQAALSVLGQSSDLDESALTYTWSLIGPNPGTASFSINGTNGAKSSIATFSTPGTYHLNVTVQDTLGRAVTSTVDLTIPPPPQVTAVTVAG
ncbi:MAG: LamG-like jellyroll fold domain-containing protein, partial [Tepidisphaeraceae bacterium]